MASLVCRPAHGAAADQRVKDPNQIWPALWDGCRDLNLPRFQARMKNFDALVKAGTAWQLSMEQEKVRIKKLNKETCAKWGQSRNGEAFLAEFLQQFSATAKTAIDLKGQIVTQLAPELEQIWKEQRQELAAKGLNFADFPCGKSLRRTSAAVEGQLKVLETLVYTVRDECPAAADQIIAAAVKAGLAPAKQATGQGAPVVVNNRAGTNPSKGGDVTGTEMQRKKSEETAKILNQQKAKTADK